MVPQWLVSSWYTGDVEATDLVKINGVLIDATSDGSAASKAAAINAKTDEHGVTATALRLSCVLKLISQFLNDQCG